MHFFHLFGHVRVLFQHMLRHGLDHFGLDPSRQSRGHYIVNTDLDDDGPWVPYAEGVWVQPCRFNVTTGGFTVVLKGFAGCKTWRSLGREIFLRPGATDTPSASDADLGQRLMRVFGATRSACRPPSHNRSA
jgi:hypothetical protein